MKKKTKIILMVIIAAAVSGFLYFFGPVFIMFGHMTYQQKKGRAYLESITEKDIPVWIARTERYLEEYDPNEYGIGVYGTEDRPVPEELRKLGIIRIDREKNCIDYLWLGGLDHTYLSVEKNEDGEYIFTAGYNDYNSRVIWPKDE